MRDTRKSDFTQRRIIDANTYVRDMTEAILHEAFDKMLAVQIKKGVSCLLPSETHVALAKAARKRLIRQIQKARIL